LCLFGDVVDVEFQPSDAGLTIESWWNDLPFAFPGTDIDAHVVMPNHFHGIVVLGTNAEIDAQFEADRGISATRRPSAGLALDEGGHAGPPLQTGSHIAMNRPDQRPTLPPDSLVGADRRVRQVSLSRIVQWYKTTTTNDYIRGVKRFGWSPFPGRLRQRNYHEHIIRNERGLDSVRRYIANNPAHWANDDENPERSRR
jgi:REP element-mobilizing transposase RayT